MQTRKLATLATTLVLALVLASGVQAQTVVSSDVSTNTIWSGEIILDGVIFVNNNATLTIDAGTIVRGQPRTGLQVVGDPTTAPGALVVTQDGTILANGTAVNPIIFTTAAVDNDQDGVADNSTPGDIYLDTWVAGDLFLDDTPATAPLAPLNADGESNVSLWGGLVLLGEAPTNLADTGNGLGRATVEGLTVPGFPVANALYGSDPVAGLEADSSGSVQYISVRHAGDQIGAGNELNGVTLAGVGSGTTFSHIEVYCNQDDGIEWFGGTVNGDHLLVQFAGDDQLDLDQGYTGTNQFTASMLPFFNDVTGNFGVASGDKGAEFDGDDASVSLDGTGKPTPFSNADFYNFTSAGSVMSTIYNGHTNNNYGWEVRNGYAGDSFNGVVYNTSDGAGPASDRQGIDVGSGGAAAGFTAPENAAAGLITFTDVICDDVAAASGVPETDALVNFGSGNIGCQDGVNDPNFALVAEDLSFTPTGVAGKLDSSLGLFDMRPLDQSPMTSAGSPGPVAAPYRGAFDPTAAKWIDGWTVFSIAGMTPVPEPGMGAMLIAGVLGLTVLPRRRR